MSEPIKASGWHYTPALPVKPAPYWDRPARPLAAFILSGVVMAASIRTGFILIDGNQLVFKTTY